MGAAVDRINARDQLGDELNATIDAQMAEAAEAGQRLRFFIFGPDGMDHSFDFRETRYGLAQAVINVATPAGLDVFCLPHKNPEGPRGFTVEVTDAGVLKIGVEIESRPLVTYSPAGWLSYEAA
jgi:formylmethanofuran:tetrahydromethanopterin formyltransferase